MATLTICSLLAIVSLVRRWEVIGYGTRLRKHRDLSRSGMNVFTRGPFTIRDKGVPNVPSTSVLAVFRSRWGEVDGYLPVLFKLKERHPQWRLITLVMTPDLARQGQEHPFLQHQLECVADVLIAPQPAGPPSPRRYRTAQSRSQLALFARGLLRKINATLGPRADRSEHESLLAYLQEQKIRLVLKDHTQNDAFLDQIERLLHPRWVIYPHGTGLYIESPEGGARVYRETPADLVVVGHEPEVACFERMLGQGANRSFRALGHPRYDTWWMERLSQAQFFRESEEVRRAARFKRTFLFATRGPGEKVLPLEIFEELCRAVGEVVLANKDHFLLIKPHPKQELSLPRKQFEGWDPAQWMISSFQTTQLASISNFVICMVSGVILDALAVGKPTVEFFRYTPGPHFFLQDAQGKIISAYKQFGLVPTAETRDELRALVDDYLLKGDNSARWQEQRRACQAFMRLDNQSSDRVVNAIDSLLRPTHS